MDLGKFDQSNYMKRQDISQDGVVLTIASFDVQTFDDGDKPFVKWREPQYKPLLLNKTNRSRLATIFKTYNTDDMVGKPVCVYDDPFIEMQGKLVGGVRLRPLKKDEAEKYFGSQGTDEKGFESDDIPF